MRSIELPHFEPDLPVAPGRDEYRVVCVSCHSPRYVTMQPPLSQTQWETTVDKMAKTFGAQFDPDQRKAILGYLVATHGPDFSRSAAPARDDDSDFGSAPVPAPVSLAAPKLPMLGEGNREAQVERGAALFAQNCAGCHGTSGRGVGWVSSALRPRPKDLASTRFSRELLSQVLWNGKRGTAMPSWRILPLDQLAALATYVQSLHESAPAEVAAQETRERGAKVFLQNCAPCHGEAGDGRGLAAATLNPSPANFQLKQPNSAYLQNVLRDGIPGTAMPSWKELLAESDRQALAGYVRSLFRGDE